MRQTPTTAGSDQMPQDLRRALEASGQQATVDRMIGSARSRFRPYATEAEARAALVAQTLSDISWCRRNKVVDVLLASANPDEVLAGKLLGLGAAGLLQVALWLSVLMVGGIGIVPILIATHVDVPWIAVALALPLFIASFLFFGSLMMGSGSLGSNMREAQQRAMVWSLTAALPLMMMGPLIQDPHGTVARVLTWIPITTAAVVMLRASMDAAALPWWEVAGAFVVLGASTWVAIRIGARLFRIGLLTFGARPSFREIIRQPGL